MPRAVVSYESSVIGDLTSSRIKALESMGIKTSVLFVTKRLFPPLHLRMHANAIPQPLG